MTRRVLVFGAEGQLGRALAETAWPAGFAPVLLDRRAADLMRPDALKDAIARHAPDAIVNAAAYTNVDGAESDEATAFAVNATAPGVIARAAAAADIPLVHVSTDYVFDGSKSEPWVESDPVAPINAYGRSKLAGEEAVRAAGPRHLILRTAWVYGARRTNFLLTMLRLAATRNEVTIVADQHGSPTAADDLAAAIARALPRLFGAGAEARFGTYHLAGASETSWHGFAEAIFAALDARGLKRPLNRAITTEEFSRPAARPANSRLSSARFSQVFGFALPGYEAALPRILDAALAAAGTKEQVDA